VLKRIIILLLCFPLIVFAKGSFTTKGLTLEKINIEPYQDIGIKVSIKY
jgi:hypothetical protein